MARDELVHSLSNFKYSICPCRQWIEIKNATRNQENSLSIVSTVLKFGNEMVIYYKYYIVTSKHLLQVLI